MSICQITISDNDDGEVTIEAGQDCTFDAEIKSHVALKAIMDMIPMIFSPADPFNIPAALMRPVEINAVDEHRIITS